MSKSNDSMKSNIFRFIGTVLLSGLVAAIVNGVLSWCIHKDTLKHDDALATVQRDDVIADVATERANWIKASTAEKADREEEVRALETAQVQAAEIAQKACLKGEVTMILESPDKIGITLVVTNTGFNTARDLEFTIRTVHEIVPSPVVDAPRALATPEVKARQIDLDWPYLLAKDRLSLEMKVRADGVRYEDEAKELYESQQYRVCCINCPDCAVIEPRFSDFIKPTPTRPATPTPTATPVASPTPATTAQVPILTASEGCLNPEATISSIQVGPFVWLAGGEAKLHVVGTANIDGLSFYKVELGWGPSADAWFYLGGGGEPIAGGLLATWDTTRFPKGMYSLRLVVVDDTGNYPHPCHITVHIPPEQFGFPWPGPLGWPTPFPWLTPLPESIW